MNNITASLESEFKQFAEAMSWISQEATDVDKAYFATDASTLVSALGSSSDGASLATKLTKAQYQNAISFIEQLKNFFGNSAVATGDYLVNIDQTIYGNAATPAFLSDAAESIANRLRVICQSCLDQFIKAKALLDLYNNSELSVVVAGCTSARTVFGASHNVGQLSQAVTLAEQFKKMINNEAVTTGLYSATVAIWLSI